MPFVSLPSLFGTVSAFAPWCIRVYRCVTKCPKLSSLRELTLSHMVSESQEHRSRLAGWFWLQISLDRGDANRWGCSYHGNPLRLRTCLQAHCLLSAGGPSSSHTGLSIGFWQHGSPDSQTRARMSETEVAIFHTPISEVLFHHFCHTPLVTENHSMWGDKAVVRIAGGGFIGAILETILAQGPEPAGRLVVED